MRVIFIAIPTKGTVKDGALTPTFLAHLAKLHVENPDCAFISPMVQDYQVLPFMNITATWEDWGKHCRAIIPRCDEVWVLKFDGWDTSVGVRGEMDCALANNIPIILKGVQ